MRDVIVPIGTIKMHAEYNDGRPPEFNYRIVKNTLLRNGKSALAKSLANDIGDGYDFYIAKMVFGNGGTQAGTPRYVDDTRNGLFGLTIASKGVISNIDPEVPNQVVFTSILSVNEGNSAAINEMGLVMANGDMYSMKTFPDLNKTSAMQITFQWELAFM